MREKWIEIEENPTYLISTHGRVMNHRTEHIKEPSINRQGILYVGIYGENGERFTRSVALLVARNFLEPPMHESFDTVIHLNGDRTDCHVDNLMWRPRWYAIHYHKQINDEIFQRFEEAEPFIVQPGGEIFTKPYEAAMKYGILPTAIVNTVWEGGKPFPGTHHFSYVEPRD